MDAFKKNALAGEEFMMPGAEPTGRYAYERAAHDYVDAGLAGANMVGAGTLAALMAADPTWFWRLVGAPTMGAAAIGSGASAIDSARRGNVYRRYGNEQSD